MVGDHHGRGKRLWSQSKVYDRAGTFPKFFGSPLPMCNPWKFHLWSFHFQTRLKIVGPGLRLIPNLVLRKFLTFNSKVRERLCWDDCLDGDFFLDRDEKNETSYRWRIVHRPEGIRQFDTTFHYDSFWITFICVWICFGIRGLRKRKTVLVAVRYVHVPIDQDPRRSRSLAIDLSHTYP